MDDQVFQNLKKLAQIVQGQDSKTALLEEALSMAEKLVDDIEEIILSISTGQPAEDWRFAISDAVVDVDSLSVKLQNASRELDEELYK